MSLELVRLVEDLRRRLERLETAGTGYSAGSWTPVYQGNVGAGTFTYSVQTGTYTRIGNRVFIRGRVVITAITGAPTGVMTIAGLPFAGLSGGGIVGAIAFGDISNFNYAANSVQLMGYCFQASTVIFLNESFDNAANAETPAANFTNTACGLAFAGFYEV